MDPDKQLLKLIIRLQIKYLNIQYNFVKLKLTLQN
jgi:hypothetical protein